MKNSLSQTHFCSNVFDKVNLRSARPVNWCRDQESNLGREALQATALPTELSLRVVRVVAGFEPASQSLTAPRTRPLCYTTHGCRRLGLYSLYYRIYRVC